MAGNGTERVAGWRACSVEAHLPINLSASSSSPLFSLPFSFATYHR